MLGDDYFTTTTGKKSILIIQHDIITLMNIHQIINSFLDIIFPARCIACKKLSRDQICDNCMKEIKLINEPICKICGKPHDKHFQGNYCHDCYLRKTPYDLARSVTIYEGIIKEALHKYKFENKHSLSDIFGRTLNAYLDHQKDMDISKIDMIIPVPLSRGKEKEREYNQAQLLAEEISKHTGIELDNSILKRKRETTPQFELSREERLNNLKDAFEADPVKNKVILLIDDIYTTGTTIAESSKALKSAGAAKVFVLTLARTLS